MRAESEAYPLDRVAAKRPRYIGHLTNDIVYGRLAPGVLDELQRLTPKTASGRRQYRFHQRLTEHIGHPALREHLASVITVMRLAPDGEWPKFMKMLDKALPKQEKMPLLDPLEERWKREEDEATRTSK